MAKHQIAMTDINVAPGIYRSMQSVYNKQHKPNADRAVRIAAKAFPFLKKKLDLPKGIKLRLASIKGNVRGWYVNGEDLAIVDYDRLSSRSILETICHELVHAEQYKQGRLASKFINGSYVYVWNGNPVRTAYFNRPHEVEARKRQVELADQFVQEFGSEIVISWLEV